MNRSLLTSIRLVAIAVALASGTVVAQQSTSPRGQSPAARRIELARKVLAGDPKRSDAWNELALALARRARESADPAYYSEAWTATEQSLQFEPGNLEGRRLQVWILLGQHEFTRAATAAETLNRAVPDDVLVYGFLVDAYVQLGRYADAEKAAQWMLDLRPGNVPGLTRAAHLRELFGDHSGAVELMDMAYRRTPEGEVEDRAWILTDIAHLSLLSCRTDAAEKLLHEALNLFPEYHYALARLAEVRVQQGRTIESVDILKRHYAAAPHPENLFGLASALQRVGRSDEAKEVFARFETSARAEMDGWDNANIELLYYYADVAGRPDEALAIGRREAARRQDVRTLEALAWALHKNGQSKEAQTTIERALQVGVRTPVTSYHAGAIAAAAGNPVVAGKYLEQSIGTCANSEAADDARQLLARVQPAVQ